MSSITIQVPDELSERLTQLTDRLPELLALSLRQPALPAHIYRYIVDFLAGAPTADELANFGPTPEMTERLRTLLDRETAIVCGYIRAGGDRDAFLARFGGAASPGFDPGRDLQRIGLANQTTMLMSGSLEIAEMVKRAMIDRYGEQDLAEHFQAFDTICSATQDRQDAVVALLRDKPVGLLIVIGGYNSSNTGNLARICAGSRPTFHIADPDCLVSATEIRHRPIGAVAEVSTEGWLPAGPVSIGLTSGASTPDNLVGAAIAKLEAFCGLSTS